MAEDEWERAKEDAYRRQRGQQNGPEPEPGSNRNFGPQGENRRTETAETVESVEPVDLWDDFEPPELPTGLLPPVIEGFARSQGRLMGVDPGGLAMATLCSAAAALTDAIKLQPHRHNPGWLELARIWVAVVGGVSDKKSPIIAVATAPLAEIDAELFRAFCKAMDAYERQTKEEKRTGPPPPKSERTLLNDTSIEAVEEALAGSAAGLMICHDELAGWFGSMERYASGRGGSDRPFWLQAYNGGRRASNRIKRGNKIIPNLSACILGGIQPDKIREIAREASDDGLLQRLLTIILKPGTIARDEPQGSEAKRYEALIRKLFEMRRRPTSALDGMVQKHLRFDDAAQQVFYRVQEDTHKLGPIKQVNSKVASAFLKAEGTFARLCVLFHCIEHAFDHDLPFEISLDTAERVERFLTEFVQPHQLAFFAGTLGLSDDQDALTKIAGLILVKGLTEVTNREVERAIGSRVKLDDWNIRKLFEQLFSLGWLIRVEQRRRNDPGTWIVNPAVHRLFAERMKAEAARREAGQAAFVKLRNHRSKSGS